MDPARDLIVVGAGAAGVCAAIEAAEAGLRVLVLEAFPEYGGAAATSGGGCCIPGTPLQASLGIADDPELAFRDWLAWGGETVDAEWARLYLSRARPDIYDWACARGAGWDFLLHQEGNTVPRWHHPTGGGAGLMQALFASAAELPVEWRTSCAASRLLVEGDGVAGVETEAGQRIVARAVVVATGGFANNPAMLREFIAAPGPGSRLLCGGARQSLGRGHQLLREAGAEFTQLSVIWCYPFGTPDFRDPAGVRGIAVRGIEPHEIWVNAQGRRFHDESRRGGWSGTQALLAQAPRTCWAVFDRGGAEVLRLDDPQYRRLGERIPERVEGFLADSPFAHRGDTPEELAAAAGLPVEAFAATLRAWNGAIAAGRERDPDYGRPLAGAHPIARPPFFALQFFPLARKNFGGARTDLRCRVLRPDGTVVTGLYAAGEVAGMAGGHINGRAGLEGTMLGPSLFSGRVAGRSAAADLGRAVGQAGD